jgi:hypothetical protein
MKRQMNSGSGSIKKQLTRDVLRVCKYNQRVQSDNADERNTIEDDCQPDRKDGRS